MYKQSLRLYNKMWNGKSQAFIFRIPGVHRSLENKGKYYPSIFEKYRLFNTLHRWTHLSAQNKMAKYFLKIKGHKHNIFSLRTGQDKMGKSILAILRTLREDQPLRIV